MSSHGRGGVGSVTDPTVRTLIMQLQDRVAQLEGALAAVQAQALGAAGTGLSAGGRRLTELADPVQDQDAVNRNYVDRVAGAQVLITRVGTVVSGKIPAALVTRGTFGELSDPTASYVFPVDLAVEGDFHVVQDTDIDGNLNVDGTLNVEGATTIDDTLHVTGNVDLDGTLNVDGTSNFEGAVVVDDTLSVTGTSNFNDAVDINDDLVVSGDTTVLGTLRTGSLSAVTTETVTEYITIETAAGTPIKLAVLN